MAVGSKIWIGPKALAGCDRAQFTPGVAWESGVSEGRVLGRLNRVANFERARPCCRNTHRGIARHLIYVVTRTGCDQVIASGAKRASAFGDFKGGEDACFDE